MQMGLMKEKKLCTRIKFLGTKRRRPPIDLQSWFYMLKCRLLHEIDWVVSAHFGNNFPG